MDTIFYIILVVLLLVILFILSEYNKFITLLNKVKKSKANIEICLKKRFDLVPNLVDCVKGYKNHEKSTLEGVTSLRNKYADKKNLNIKETESIDNELNKYLVTIEAYPELKANEEFLSLQNELKEIEDEIVAQRYLYNDVVTRYNTLIEKVPSNFVASIFGFKKTELFGIKDEEKENVKVKI